MKNKKLHIWVALAVIVLFVCLAVFGCGEDIKGIRDMRFGIYTYLEKCADACEHVADIVGSVAMKNT